MYEYRRNESGERCRRLQAVAAISTARRMASRNRDRGCRTVRLAPLAEAGNHPAAEACDLPAEHLHIKTRLAAVMEETAAAAKPISCVSK
jgi:hypothetical protein